MPKSEDLDSAAQVELIRDGYGVELMQSISANPQAIAKALHEEGVIDDNEYRRTLREDLTVDTKATLVVSYFIDRAKCDSGDFKKFVEVFSELEWTKEVMERIQSSLTQKLKLGKPTGKKSADYVSLVKTQSNRVESLCS